MTQNEFFEVTREIEKFYEKELTTEQSRVWFDELKNLTKERYRSISREVYKTLKFMPKLVDIIELNKNLSATKTVDNEIYDCNICNGTGIVLYRQFIEDLGREYEFAARCNCKNGDKISRKVKSIDELGLVV